MDLSLNNLQCEVCKSELEFEWNFDDIHIEYRSYYSIKCTKCGIKYLPCELCSKKYIDIYCENYAKFHDEYEKNLIEPKHVCDLLATNYWNFDKDLPIVLCQFMGTNNKCGNIDQYTNIGKYKYHMETRPKIFSYWKCFVCLKKVELYSFPDVINFSC